MSLQINDPLEGTPFAMQVAERVEKKVKRVNHGKGDILAEIARLKAENDALRAKNAVKATEKASCACDKTSTLPDKCKQVDTTPIVSVVEPVSPSVEETKPAEIVPVEETTTVVEVSFKPEPEQKQVRDTTGWPAWRKRMYGIK